MNSCSNDKRINSIMKAINALREETIVFDDSVRRLFYIAENPGGGDCLFNAFSQLLYGSLQKSESIREMVARFYDTFDAHQTYPDLSLEHSIALMSMADPFDDDGRAHAKVIGEQGVYGNITDMYVCARLFHCNVMVFVYGAEDVRVIPIVHKDGLCTVHVKFNGVDHYEAMLPRRYYMKGLVGQIYRDSRGMYEVQYFETKLNHEDSLLYVGYRKNGTQVAKTEYQLLVDSQQIEEPLKDDRHRRLLRQLKKGFY